MDLGTVALWVVAILVLLSLLRRLFPSRRSGDAPSPPHHPHPGGPHGPGEPGPPEHEPGAAVETATPHQVGASLRSALARGADVYGVPAAAEDDQEVQAVVWTDLGDEVLVHLDSLSVEVGDGVIEASLDLETEQTGRQKMTVPFAVGATREDGAALVVTEDLPRGHEGLAARWGQAVQAALWAGVLDEARRLARAADGIPGRIWTHEGRIRFEASAPTQLVPRAASGRPETGSPSTP